MTCSGITANNQNAGSLTDLANRIGHSTAAEGGGQTGHRRGVSETGTMVDIIGTHYHTSELLGQIILLVGTFS